MIRRGPWKLIEAFDPEQIELYHLESDPGEQSNLAGAKPDIAADLWRELEAWRLRVDADRMLPNPDYDPTAAKTVKKAGKGEE